ncbi:hypothetical protein LCGC14_2319960 [marine sediment metagenome]|uniref:Uncharacterized protein n=1 Tax=marine sediment metagenome TaxID=412755 RepID=A0A0F9D5L9_9ZZZZ
MGFGARRGLRRVLIPSTEEVLSPRQDIQVTVLGESGVRFSVDQAGNLKTRRVGARDRFDSERGRGSRELISAPLRDDQLESFFVQPRRPRGIAEAPETFRPRVAPRRPTRRALTPFTSQEGQPQETLRDVEFRSPPPIDITSLDQPPIEAKIFPEIKVIGSEGIVVFGGQKILDF